MRRKISCVIIDDEPPASDILESYINKTPDFEVSKVFNDPIKALEGLNNIKADVIFCDVEMPDINGLELLGSLFQSQDSLIVIVSAHTKYAIDGFNINAIDYLLKPVSFARYLKTTQKILHQLMDRDLESRDAQVQTSLIELPKDHFFIKSNNRLLKINYSDILFIEGLGDYIKIHLESSSKPVLILDSLKHLEETLSSTLFKRIHRSYIIPISRIKAIEYRRVIIGDNLSLPISNSYYDTLYDSLISNKIIK
ncbi:LytR/AlgR family response regulator transcription factor [Dysgonomonas macrotermitis]|uniref:Two component transcriptional regulator, LytTR family n=1 Tax=Dysgonomonas macrotermitis TaxID=1346286 RepID=A0A1M4WBX3_9BACT|nr:LytTR family DNA-binding domain-containing protein [Dysgonomonas macrotermitis]SHE78462.1 two component transcriptional regulator, LytTR family [Dysgonomonas macrotermitis]